MRLTLTQTIAHPKDLSSATLAAMYQVFHQYYDASEYDQFKHDLLEKSHVLLLKNPVDDSIAGFTTALIMSFIDGSKPFNAIFSGDTIIQRQFWGSQYLPLYWCQFAGHIKQANSSNPLYWFLIVKGHRTYRYLPLFAKRFYPTWRYPTPNHIKSRLDIMAARKFGDNYNPDTGIIRFSKSKGHLKKAWAEIPSHLHNKPDIDFFLKCNPNYHAGDELACITELTEENLKSHALRAFRRALA